MASLNASRARISVVFALLLTLSIPGANALASTQSLSGCAAHLTSNKSGHSYCTYGGTSGLQRVKLWCYNPYNPGDQFVARGAWQVAGAWSEASCPGDYLADQAQYELT